MKTQEPAPLSKGFRFPAESIGHGIWLSFRFSLRFRESEEMMAERGVVLTTKRSGSGVCRPAFPGSSLVYASLGKH